VTGRLIISPHLDDAVLSCWHAITTAPEPATVVTLFAGLPSAAAKVAPWDRASGVTDPAEHVLRRRREDEAALGLCGARFVHCDFLDDQYRDWARPRRALIERLEELTKDAEEVWVPAGIGAHPDHVLAAEAALSATAGRRRVLYADLPYATHRRAGLGAGERRALTPRQKVKAALIRSPYVPDRPPTPYRLTAEEQGAKRRCLDRYESQLPGLARAHGDWWDNRELFGLEWWWPGDDVVQPRRGGAVHWSICRLRRKWGERERQRRQAS
jgi:LmbE family N-acetylglucosaminyl deacetylase